MAPATSYILFLSIFSLAFARGAAQPRQSNISLESSLHSSSNSTSWPSPSGRFAFGFYPEGTGFSIGIWLVASSENTTVIWEADPGDQPVTKDAVLKLTNEGLKLLLPQSEGRVISQISTNTDAFSASMLDSGNFVIYDSNFNVVWQTFGNPTDTIMAGRVLLAGKELVSRVSAQCGVKGTCGVNSYCTSVDEQVVCLCPPGFDYLDTSSTSSGCRINTSAIGFFLNDNNMTYMTTLENVTWTVDSYTAPLKVTRKEDCSDACLRDSNCGAALLEDNTCIKQALPLRYGKGGSAATTFIKLVNISAGERSPAAAPTTKQKFSAKILVVSVAVFAGIMSTLAALVFFFYRHRAGRYRRMGRNGEAALVDEIAPRSFSYHELREATHGFKEELGKGAFGTVFKGTLPSSERAIAVKRLAKVVDEGEREFRTEMRTIGRTHHKNLVRLLGFCDEGTNRLLVYECMSNGSLADLIFKADRHPDWDERVRIALDIAGGIHYLHEECETRIIHCDIKPQNILMDDNWTAKISDFGLAKLLMPSQTRTFTGIRGTRGYLAPEWHKNVPITVKADVYSFGIALLEIICCRKNMELEAEADEISLLDWVHNCFMEGELEKLVPDEVDMAELNRLVQVGLWCTQPEPGSRPSMRNVVMMLEGNVGVSLPPPPGFSS